MSKVNKQNKIQAKQKAQEENDSQVVVMKFSEDKFYNDQTIPHFEKGKEYEVRGGDQILRWLKRGGVIVSGELSIPEHKLNLSGLVQNEHSEQKPYVSDAEKKELEEQKVANEEDSGNDKPKENSEESEVEIDLDGQE